MKERNLCIFAEKQRGSRLCLPALSMALMAAGLSVGCGVQAQGSAMEQQAGVESASARIQTFTSEEAAVVPAVRQYDFEEAAELGDVTKLRGMLPGASEGVWYLISIDGVEYYYGAYDSGDADCFGYAIFSDRYALENGIKVGMTMAEILEEYPDLAVVNASENDLDGGVRGCQGWNGTAYPRSPRGMDKKWAYDGGDYQWADQFDCMMLADVGAKTEDELPVQAGLMVKDGVIAAITFFYPTAG